MANKYLERLLDAQNELESAETAYLLSHGWTSTSHSPGSYWLWTRDFADYDKRFDEWYAKNPECERKRYGVFSVPKDLAISMSQRCLEEDDEEIEG